MTTVTIPRELAKKGDLIIIPRKEYEQLLVFRKNYTEFDHDLGEAIQQVKKGETFGPFNSAAELKKSLEK